MDVSTVDARGAILLTSEETRDRKLKTSSRKRASITLRDKDYWIQMMKSCNLEMNMMIGIKQRGNSLILFRIWFTATCSYLESVFPLDSLVISWGDHLNSLQRLEIKPKEVCKKEEAGERVNDSYNMIIIRI